jgi:hypothetical protein
MFKFLKKILSKRKNSPPFMCSINFELNYDGTINIICYWPNFDKNNMDKISPVSTEFSTLLHMINTGMLQNDTITTLTSLTDKSNTFDNMFIQLCLVKLLEYSENKKSDAQKYDPVVKPSSVFKQYSTR